MQTIPETSPSQRAAGHATPPADASEHTKYWDIDHSAYGEVNAVKRTKLEQVAAENLQASASVIPAVTHTDHALIDKLESVRGDLKGVLLKQDVKLSSLALIILAVGRALKKYPSFNSSLSSDGKTLYLKNYISIGVAVDTPHGLMVPVIRNVHDKGLSAIASELSALANKAKERKLKPTEFGGASMTVSSLGGIGGDHFTPIVNPPEVAILGISSSQEAPVWDGNQFVPQKKLPLHLTYDHRVINGADAARFCRYLVSLLENPENLLL